MAYARGEDGASIVDEPASEQRSIKEDPVRVASIAAGSLLTFAGLSRGGVLGLASAAVGGNLVYGGVKGSSPLMKLIGADGSSAASDSAVIPHGQGVKREQAVIIDRPREELYRFWHDFRNLPRFMESIESVEVLDSVSSRWRMAMPGAGSIEWTAETYNDVDNELIAWRSLPDAQVANAGTVVFKDATGRRGTQVNLVINYRPPLGMLPAAIAKLLPDDPAGQMAYNTLRRFKQYMETGEVATSRYRHDMMSNEAPRLEPRQAGSSADVERRSA
jgi:uncharacterized membrane protein